jgi:hypothetical protein
MRFLMTLGGASHVPSVRIKVITTVAATARHLDCMNGCKTARSTEEQKKPTLDEVELEFIGATGKEKGMQILIGEFLTRRPLCSIAQEPRRSLLTRISNGTTMVNHSPGLPFPQTPDVTSLGNHFLLSRKDVACHIVRRAGVDAVIDLAEEFQLTRVRLYRLP